MIRTETWIRKVMQETIQRGVLSWQVIHVHDNSSLSVRMVTLGV